MLPTQTAIFLRVTPPDRQLFPGQEKGQARNFQCVSNSIHDLFESDTTRGQDSANFTLTSNCAHVRTVLSFRRPTAVPILLGLPSATQSAMHGLLQRIEAASGGPLQRMSNGGMIDSTARGRIDMRVHVKPPGQECSKFPLASTCAHFVWTSSRHPQSANH